MQGLDALRIPAVVPLRTLFALMQARLEGMRYHLPSGAHLRFVAMRLPVGVPRTTGSSAAPGESNTAATRAGSCAGDNSGITLPAGLETDSTSIIPAWNNAYEIGPSAKSRRRRLA